MTQSITKQDPERQLTLHILPHHRDEIKHYRALDDKWKALHQVEVSLRAALDLPWPGRQHDQLFSCLGNIHQLMTDIEHESEGSSYLDGNGRML